MSWFGHTFLVTIQDVFLDRLWEPNPKKAAQIIHKDGHQDVAEFVEKMTPKEWSETHQWACVPKT